MYLLVAVLTIACATEIVAGCSNEATFDLENKYCESDVVCFINFYQAISGVAFREDGRQMEFSTFEGNVSDYLRDTTKKLSKELSVGRTYTQGDPCEAASFPGQGPFLIFANKTASDGYVQVSPCDYAVEWECVSPDERERLSSTTCSD